MGSALENLQSRLRVEFAKTQVRRHLRKTEEGIEDVGAHLRLLDEMHAPADPALQGDRPETRQLKDLPPGLKAVYDVIQKNVGARKAAALQEKVGGGNRKPGYLKSERIVKGKALGNVVEGPGLRERMEGEYEGPDQPVWYVEGQWTGKSPGSRRFGPFFTPRDAEKVLNANPELKGASVTKGRASAAGRVESKVSGKAIGKYNPPGPGQFDKSPRQTWLVSWATGGAAPEAHEKEFASEREMDEHIQNIRRGLTNYINVAPPGVGRPSATTVYQKGTGRETALESREEIAGRKAEEHARFLYDKYEAATEANLQARIQIEAQYQKALYAPRGKQAAYDRKVAASGKAFTRLIDHLEKTTPPPAGHNTWMDVKPTELREYFKQ